MSETKFELTEEQRKAILGLVDTIKRTIKDICEAIIQFVKDISEAFRDYVMSLQPKKRYKLLKRLGIKNYTPFFKRDRIIRYRNNC